jgi:hypothetical protein
MKTFAVKQGSVEWHLARAGVITASNFHLLRASAKLKVGANKGDYNEKAKNLAFHLALEREAGTTVAGEDWSGWQAERGIVLEPEARRQHELRHDVMVEEVGFVTTDDGKFGASADGMLIGRKAGAEYKCYLAPDKIRAITLSGDTSMVIDQCDGGMWITGMDEWHFCLYCPALKPLNLDLQLAVIPRDDDRIYELERDLVTFDRLVEEYRAALVHRAKVGLSLPEPAPWAGADELAKARPAPQPPAPPTGMLSGGIAPAAAPVARTPLPESIF